MDPERDEERQRYRLCRAGFGGIAFALVLALADRVLFLSSMLMPMPPELRAFLHSPGWDWLIGSPITWVSLVAVTLLWGRWTDTSWQRRAGLLVVMNLVDVILWTIEHGDALGLRTGDIGHPWLREELGFALGWAELALVASLAADVAVHLGRDAAAEAGVVARSVLAVGAFLFLLSFYALTDWPRGWPLVVRGQQRVWHVHVFLAWIGAHVLFTVALFQVSALCIAAYRLCGQALSQMDREDQDHDLLRPRSESEAFAEPKASWPDDADDPWR